MAEWELWKWSTPKPISGRNGSHTKQKEGRLLEATRENKHLQHSYHSWIIFNEHNWVCEYLKSYFKNFRERLSIKPNPSSWSNSQFSEYHHTGNKYYTEIFHCDHSFIDHTVTFYVYSYFCKALSYPQPKWWIWQVCWLSLKFLRLGCAFCPTDMHKISIARSI